MEIYSLFLFLTVLLPFQFSCANVIAFPAESVKQTLVARSPLPQGLLGGLGSTLTGLGNTVGGIGSALGSTVGGLGTALGGLLGGGGGSGNRQQGSQSRQPDRRPPPPREPDRRPPPPREPDRRPPPREPERRPPPREPERRPPPREPERRPPPREPERRPPPPRPEWGSPPPRPEWGSPRPEFDDELPSPVFLEPVPVPRAPRVPSMLVTTDGSIVCRRYPDTINQDLSKLPHYTFATRLEVVCYTTSSMPSDNQSPDATWLKTNEGCYINAREVSERHDYTTMLNYCMAPFHFVGILQPQYGREDCYDCPSLDCPSRDLGVPPYVDVGCSTEGDIVRDNRTWFRSRDQSCYLPGGAFIPNGWLGTPGGRC